MQREIRLQASQPGYSIPGELTGFDEQVVAGEHSMAAVHLLAQCAHIDIAAARALSVSERDMLLLRAYQSTFGDLIESTAECSGCAKPYDVTFSLSLLVRTLTDVPRPEGLLAHDDGTFSLSSGGRFRAPTGEDELAIENLPLQEAERALRERCTLAPGDIHAIEEAMQSVAPILSVPVSASCPECGTTANFEFDLQHFLLARILRGRALRLQETHRLASAYKWSLTEIFGLPRSQRRAFCELIEAERSNRGRPA